MKKKILLVVMMSFSWSLSYGSIPGCFDGPADHPDRGWIIPGILRTRLCENSNTDFETVIDRTYILKSKKSFGKGKYRRNTKSNNNPLLDIKIDKEDLLTLFAPGNRRIFYETAYDTTNTIIMDVGYANQDTQYWSIPTLDFVSRRHVESIDSSQSPFKADFPDANLVYKTLESASGDTSYSHYYIDDNILTERGLAGESNGNPFFLEQFETQAFLPIEFGWDIEETTTSYWFTDDLDSLVETKHLSMDANGILTPINEEPVEAVIAYLVHTYEFYKDGEVTEAGYYDAFVWFTREGHWIIGYLAENAPTEGVTEFVQFSYDKNIIQCPTSQDLGINLPIATYKAQNEINSAAQLSSGPIQFLASQGIHLKRGFSTNGEFSAIISDTPCNED